jgi:hypothetical protein
LSPRSYQPIAENTGGADMSTARSTVIARRRSRRSNPALSFFLPWIALLRSQ